MVRNHSELKTIIEINVTPLVDVCLVLVIIFMVTVPLLLQPMAAVMLPQAVTALEERKDVVFLTITPQDQIIVDRLEIKVEDLIDKLQTRLAESATKTVIIRADQRVKYKLVRQVVDKAKEAGAKKTVFATELKQPVH